MKKSIIASVVALGMVSGLAQAANNEIQFHGTVSTVTCDLGAFVDGSMNPNGNRIELGDLKVGETGKPVNFSFKPTADNANVAACDGISKDPNVTKVVMAWNSNSFDSNGLGLILGDAKGSFVQITPVNNTVAQGGTRNFITASNTEHEFNKSVLASGGEGLKYTALLKAGTTPGDFQTAATFTMSYN